MQSPPGADGVLLNAHLVTLDEPFAWGSLEHGALAWRDGVLDFVGVQERLPMDRIGPTTRVYDAGQRLVTTGLIDCHTHLVFAGDRSKEFEMRLGGESYEAISRAGGGIMSTVHQVRAACEAELLAQSLPRARALIADGVTALEIKSGYGLNFEAERKMLRVARQLGQQLGIAVQCTFLGAHAVPPEYAGRADDYIDAVCSWIKPLHDEGLIDAVDAFCEGIGFSVAQVSRVFDTARALGLPVKLHADQLSDLGGARLLAEYGGLSADHVEYSNANGIAAMAASRSVAVLLPGAFHMLRETQLPPLDTIAKHDVAVAVATDCNPGTSPLLSLRQAMQLACTHFQLSALHALRGATLNAARALGWTDRGLLAEGYRADFALWNVRQPAELCYWMGGQLLHASFGDGRPLFA